MGNYNPNPFDFVPFTNGGPELKTPIEWLRSGGDLLTGHIEVQIEALTPVHIAGIVDSDSTGNKDHDKNNVKMNRSHFRRTQGKPCIPASSLRGMLRSFIEAATNGWVSEITPYYPEKKDSRQVGFMTIDAEEQIAKDRNRDKIDPEIAKLLPQEFRPHVNSENTIDLASFLFGHVIDKKAARGRVQFSDINISETLDFNNFIMPDISGDALMGGPNPSARSWWYLEPLAIRKRKKPGNKPGSFWTLIDFLGSQFRGRKFYYHQDSVECVNWYLDNWKVENKKTLYDYKIESLPPESKTSAFRIGFEEIPRNMLHLLLWALQPGENFCHKIGNGKQYGFGSIRIHVLTYKAEPSVLQSGIAEPINSDLIPQHESLDWTEEILRSFGVRSYLEDSCLQALARILYYEKPFRQIFTWPPFSGEGFKPRQPIGNQDVKQALSRCGIAENYIRTRGGKEVMSVTPIQAYEIAEKLDQKPALHFEVYQENAQGYDEIQNRKLADALGG